MNFTQFWAKCISMFGSWIKAPKLKAATNNISSSGALKEQKTHSQKKNISKGRKIQAQTELIEKQKLEIENLKAMQATEVKPTTISNQLYHRPCLACMWATRKIHPVRSHSGNKFMGTPRPPKPSAGVDRSLHNNLTCQYCKDTGHELENCRWLKNELACKCTATQSIATEESLNPKTSLKQNLINDEKVKGSQPLPRLDKHEIGPQTKLQVQSMQTQFKIMKRTVAKCPNIKLKVMAEPVPSLLDSSSMVSLMWQDHFNRHFRPQLGPAEGSVADPHHLFHLTSASAGAISLSRYVETG